MIYGSCSEDMEQSSRTWKGTLEDLKAFILTEIDEETAAHTTWRSPGGGTWNFESKLLAVTGLTKSQNIYFDGEKGNNLIERVHGFLKRRKSASETSSYVDLLESQSQVEDESVACTTSDHLQNTAGNSVKVYSLSNNDITANKNTNFDHEKQGEAILHAESINRDNSNVKLLSENACSKSTD